MSSSKPRSDAAERLLASAIRYTGTGVRSTQQVLAYLRRAGASSGTAARIVAACRARGLVDDPASARLWAEHFARRGYAWSAIRSKLSGKGFADDDIAAARRHLGAAADDAARARGVASSYLRRRPRATATRLARALAVRGFDEELIAQVVAASADSVRSDAER